MRSEPVQKKRVEKQRKKPMTKEKQQDCKHERGIYYKAVR
jgi:hypothetical protein